MPIITETINLGLFQQAGHNMECQFRLYRSQFFHYRQKFVGNTERVILDLEKFDQPVFALGQAGAIDLEIPRNLHRKKTFTQ